MLRLKKRGERDTDTRFLYNDMKRKIFLTTLLLGAVFFLLPDIVKADTVFLNLNNQNMSSAWGAGDPSWWIGQTFNSGTSTNISKVTLRDTKTEQTTIKTYLNLGSTCAGATPTNAIASSTDIVNTVTNTDFTYTLSTRFNIQPSTNYCIWFIKTNGQNSELWSYNSNYYAGGMRYSGYNNLNSANTTIELYLILQTVLPYCGDSLTNGSEVCDGNTTACATGEGYAGTKTCNGTCDGWGSCSSGEFCDDGIVNGYETCDDGEASNGLIMKGCNATCDGIVPLTSGGAFTSITDKIINFLINTIQYLAMYVLPIIIALWFLKWFAGYIFGWFKKRDDRKIYNNLQKAILKNSIKK